MTVSRRTFLGLLAASPLFGAKAVRAKKAKEYKLNVFSVAGFQYHDGPKLLGLIRPGDRLGLAAEPDNPHDKYAVKILWADSLIGYVPRSDNRHLSRLLRQEARLTGRVVEVQADEVPWRAVRVGVWLGGVWK